jgi:hypothetical protein
MDDRTEQLESALCHLATALAAVTVITNSLAALHSPGLLATPEFADARNALATAWRLLPCTPPIRPSPP